MPIVQCRANARGILPLFGAASIAALMLSACTKSTPESSPPEVIATSNPADTRAGELNWASDALKRNPTIEVVATDTNAGVFTVRFKDSGEVRAMKLNELAAVPVASLTVARTPVTVDAQAPATTTAAAPPPETTAAASAPAATTSAPTATAQNAAGGNPNYTIERADGQVKVSGPGVSIVSTGTSTVSATQGAAGQRSAEPIICEGRRMLHFDNRNIDVDGDAIVARGGCELYITNSRVIASGTAVVIRDATVHIANSTIEGAAASFDANDSAKVYVRSSTFQGLPRRAERAVVQDQGGNQWR
jgi:hypothetical protein